MNKECTRLAPTLATHHASAERLAGAPLQAQIEYFNEARSILRLFDVVSGGVLVLNEHRQVVFANSAFFEFCKAPPAEILGLRFGEILDCRHHKTDPGGCGTSRQCSVCGAMRLIRHAQEMRLSDSGTCSISLSNWDSLELEIKVTPHETEIGHFTFFTFTDVSDAKRRKALERVFFHDLLNTAGGMRGIAQILEEDASAPEFSKIAVHLAEDLIEEIEAQRTLVAAETGELSPESQTIDTATLLDRIAEVFARNEVTQGKTLRTQIAGAPPWFQSDPVLVRRVLTNMVKNAFEAHSTEGVVRLTARQEADCIVFDVHNDSVMKPEVQLRVFHRSFSTKGEGRGIGTYSMRLLGEKYLGGKLSFQSKPGEGTTFRLALPLNLPTS